MHWHLATLEAHSGSAARTRLLTFVAAASGFTQARSNSTADATFRVFRALCGLDVIEFHHQPLENFDQVADLVDHSAHSRCVLQLTGAVELAQPQTAHSRTVGFFGTDWATHQLDLHCLLCCHFEFLD
jgi:hypothetical protein